MRVLGSLVGLMILLAGCGQGVDDAPLPPLPDDPAVTAELRNIFNAHDTDGDGRVLVSDVARFGQSVFAGMDVRTDGEIAPREWRGYGILESIARDNGRSAEYEGAKRRVFQRYDTDGDVSLSAAELRNGVAGDFADADEDTDGAISISYEEFTASRFIREMAHASASPT